VIRVALAAVLTLTCVAGAAKPAPLAGSCPATIAPSRPVPPAAAFTARAFDYGNRYLRVQLNWPA
jgi:hypothetical protein